MLKNLVMLLVWLLCVGTTSFNVGAQDCSALETLIANGGIYDVFSRSGSNNQSKSFASWYCDSNYSSQQSAHNDGLTIGIPIAEIPAKFGFTSQGTDWSTAYRNFCSSVRSDQQLQTKFNEYVSTVNPAVLRAFEKCVESEGLHVWLERTFDPTVFLFIGQLKSTSPTNTKVKIDSFVTTGNVSCHETPRTIGTNSFTTICYRKDDEAITVIINAEVRPRGGNRLSLPRISRPTDPVPPPPAPACAGATDVVKTIYINVLGRQADESGLIGGIALLLQTGSVKELLRGIGNSIEYNEKFIKSKPAEEAVTNIYRHFLGRNPEDGGKAQHMVTCPATGFAGCISRMLDGPEYADTFGFTKVPDVNADPRVRAKIRYCN